MIFAVSFSRSRVLFRIFQRRFYKIHEIVVQRYYGTSINRAPLPVQHSLDPDSVVPVLPELLCIKIYQTHYILAAARVKYNSR